MTIKVLLRSVVLLLIFPIRETFATASVTWTDDPVLDPDTETSLIGRHRQKSISHRIKRNWWYLFDGSDEKSSTTETWETAAAEILEMCYHETQFLCQSGDHCIPLSARCDGIFNCIDESDEANCTLPQDPTSTEVPEAKVTTDCVKAFLEAVEKKPAGVNEPNGELVHQLTCALKDFNASNEALEKKYAGLQERIADLGKTVADYHRRIAHLEAILSDRSATRSASSEQKFMELECRAFATDLITARKRYFP